MRRLAPLLVLAAAIPVISAQPSPHAPAMFESSDRCLACHNGLATASGEDVSIGTSWRVSMMANSARDPYWQASVRRETIDHPKAAAAIQDECATCHMPMARTLARAAGGEGEVFAHLPATRAGDERDRLAHDGVACALCHQITDRNLGEAASFTGGYSIAPSDVSSPRRMFGPFKIERGMTTIMRSATGFEPSEAPHVRQSELCATCHTLITSARGPDGAVVGQLPEQVPFLEWKHSAYASEQRSCQSCHMPVVEEEVPIASVLGAPRKGFARHTFVGGNFFMQRLFARYGAELGVPAPAHELNAAAEATLRSLRAETARLTLDSRRDQGRLAVTVHVENLTGHKLPTGYPSRRVWLHVTVRDRQGRPVFESGGIDARGAIAGNDHDADPLAVEPHHDTIVRADQVQIYESVMRDASGRPTTGLLTATGFAKDNRLLPRGFDKTTAEARVAPVGDSLSDGDFAGGGDRVRYLVDTAGAEGPFAVEAELRFQVIAYRWAENLRPYDSDETRRFVGYYEAMAASASEVIGRVTATSE